MAWLSGWSRRVKGTIKTTNVDDDLTHFPIAIFIDSTSGISKDDLTAIFTELGTNSRKIAITKDDGETQLYAEVDTWDSSAKKAVIWASKYDWVISKNSDTVFYLYFDKNQPDNTIYIGVTPDNVASNCVWDSHYVMVQHMNDATTSTIKDSTVNNNDGTKKASNQPIQADGQIGKAQDFDGSDDKINTVSLNNNANLTVSAIIKMDVDSGWIVNKRDNAADIQWQLYHSGGKLIANLFIGTSTAVGSVLDGASCLGGAYHHVAFTTTGVTGGSLILYKDGGVTGTPATLTGNMKLGSRAVVIGMTAWIDWATGAFDGLIDEVRISNITRAAEWIKAEYYAQTDDIIEWDTIEHNVVLSDSISLSEVLAKSQGHNRLPTDALSISDSLSRQVNYQRALLDSVSMLDKLARTMAMVNFFYDPRKTIRNHISDDNDLFQTGTIQKTITITNLGIDYHIPIYLTEETKSSNSPLPPMPFIELALESNAQPFNVLATGRKRVAKIIATIYYAKNDDVHQITLGKLISDELCNLIRTYQCHMFEVDFINVNNTGRVIEEYRNKQVVYKKQMELYVLHYNL